MADNTTISQINKLNSSLRWVNRILILLFLFVLALSAAGGWGLFLLSTRLIAVENMKVELYTKLDSFGGMIAEIKDSLARHEDIILRLNNRTTNADVLDKLQEYSKSIDDVVNNVHSLLDRNLVTVTSLTEVTTREVYNVANNMTRKVDADLNDIKQEVNHQLEDSKLNVRKTVEKALNEVNEVQFNVANQLDIMTSYVNESVATIRSVMEEATHTIHEEVEKVKVSVEDYVLISNEQFAKENDFVKYQLAGTFTLIGCLISLWHLTSHQRHLSKPDIQRRVMAVLWMVPVYSVTSWLSLVFPKIEYYMSSARDIYEAYVVYTFIALLIAIIEDGKGLSGLLQVITMHVIHEREATRNAKEKRTSLPKQHIVPPFSWNTSAQRPDVVARAWLFQCKLMAMQFVIFKPLLGAIPFLSLQIFGLDLTTQDPPVLPNHQLNYASPSLYIAICKNVSVAAAFYGLLSFYHGTEKDLAWCNPWPKFLCIKGVVFATFWQGVGIQTMCSLGVINDRAALQIQSLLICIEMLLASIAHFYIFPYEEWQEGYKREKEKGILLRDTLALRDFLGDMRMMVTNWDSHTLKIPLPEEHHLPVNADGDKETLKKEITSAVDSACFTLSGMDAEGKEEYLKSRGEEGLESFEGLRNLFPVFGEEPVHKDDDEERGSSLRRSERSPLLSSSVKSYTGSDRLYTRSLM